MHLQDHQRVLQDLDFVARRDDFSAGQAVSPVNAGCSRRLVADRLLSGTAGQQFSGVAKEGANPSCSK
jgi:hypothetical protein